MFNSVWSGGTLSSKISGLPVGQPLQTGDEFAIARAGANYRVTWQDIINGLTVPSYANIIVVDNGGNGDYTTVSGAMTDATSGDLIILVNDVTEASAITWKDGVGLAVLGGVTYTYQPVGGSTNAFVIGDGVTAAVYGPGRILADGSLLGGFDAIGCFGATGSAAKNLSLWGGLVIEIDNGSSSSAIICATTNVVLSANNIRFVSSGSLVGSLVINGDAEVTNCVFNEVFPQLSTNQPIRLSNCTIVQETNSIGLLVDYSSGVLDSEFIVDNCYIESAASGLIYTLDLGGGPLASAPVYNCVIKGTIDPNITSFDPGTAYATNVQV